MNIINKIQKDLFSHQDKKYRDFQARLMPNVAKETIIGVRTLTIRLLAKRYIKENNIKQFLDTLPHQYYEEYNLHSFILNEEKDFTKVIQYLDKLLPYVNNWATCDSLDVKIFKKHKKELLNEIKRYLKSKKPFIIRFAIKMLMKYYLDNDFKEEYLQLVCAINNNHYYVKMMQAWYIATALAKQYLVTIKYIEQKRLSPWIHNKSIQKALESYRISKEEKEYLKNLKV